MSKAPAKMTAREMRLLKAIARLHRAAGELRKAVAALRAERGRKVKQNWK